MSIENELKQIEQAEARLQRQAHRDRSRWKAELEAKVPEKVTRNLNTVFFKAFEMIFEKGTGLIEKSLPKASIQKDFRIRSDAAELEMGWKDQLLLNANAELSHLANLLASTAEGVGLGSLGIGLPDIVLFVSMILRGCYEAALRYGFTYDQPEDRYFILALLEGSMLKDSEWDDFSDWVDSLIAYPYIPTAEELTAQIKQTADVLAADMLFTKFIQGIPIIGIVGGAMNPLYYRKVMRYVRLKYRKRFLLQKSASEKK